jgi:hypothetical protein
MNSESENSIYNYNMIFNKVNNVNNEDDNDFNTNVISDINLQNFDIKRYEYYTNLVYIYKKDPDTLYNLLNKYYNIKNLKKKEKKLIKYIFNYARLLKDKDKDKEGNYREGQKSVAETLKREVRTEQFVGGNSKYKGLIDKLKDNINKSKPSIVSRKNIKDDEAINTAKSSTNDVEDLQIKKDKLEKILELLKRTQNDIIKYEEDLSTEEKEDANKLLNKTVKPSIDIINQLLASIKKKETSQLSKESTSSIEEDGTSSDREFDKSITIIKEIMPTKLLNKSVKPAIDIIKKLLASINKKKATTTQPDDNKLSHSNAVLNAVSIDDDGDKVAHVGGISNEGLKIKYLDTQKYKGLKHNDDKDALEKYYDTLTEDDNNKIGQLSNDIDEYYTNEDTEPEKNEKNIIQRIKNFENDPKNPLEELELTFDDRIVFIIATFFIRYITIIMVQWCIDINIIKTFYEGFIYYAVIYITIFWFIVLFINIDNSFDVKYMNFNGIINSIRTLFYYFYMGTNGISRLLIHTSLIMILIIIPIILNIKNKAEFKDEDNVEIIKILNYDERKQLSKSLSLFTMFIWLFTSIIATKF